MIKILRFLYSLLILASGVYLYYFFLASDLGLYSQLELAAFASTFFIVVVFAFLMLIFLAKYLPSTLAGMLNLILGPIAFLVLDFFFNSGQNISHHLTITGIIYLASLVFAFIIVVINHKDRKAALIQLFFILPAILALYIFAKYIDHSFTAPNLIFKYLYFALIVIEQTFSLRRQIKAETLAL
ncbi:hypothetical protein KA119_00380 [Candidatus Gracilibacteria bacterium]|nr:hypothetical protein [Candidatus Gracilibacteria bacterium]